MKVNSLSKDEIVTSIETLDRRNRPVISTMPMPVLAKVLNYSHDQKFNLEMINVRRYVIEDADVYQTVYYPDPELPVYRASITGNLLIIESIADQEHESDLYDEEVIKSFGLFPSCCKFKDSGSQGGKITPIDDTFRKKFILKTTIEHGVYSLGRFAVWRQVLMDDVYYDILKIRELTTKTNYDLHLIG